MNGNGNRWLVRLPIAVDVMMIISMFSLAYWVGTQAEEIRVLSVQMQTVQAQLSTQTSAVDIAKLEAQTDAREREVTDLKDYFNSRFDRIERKLDARP